MRLEKIAIAYKNGDQKAFDIIYKETYSYVRFAIYSYVQNKYIVEDLIQDTYMKITKNISSYNYNSFSNWVYTIAKNTALDYARKKKEVVLEDTSYIPDNATNPYLNYALSHLDPKLREVFLMKVLLGHTSKKIASILELKPSQVNLMYYEARASLKKSLKEDDFDEIK